MAGFRRHPDTEIQNASVALKSVFPANQTLWKWELGVRENGAEIFHLQWKFQIIPNPLAVIYLQEEQMGACEHGSFRRSGEDVLPKFPWGVHLVQAKTTYPMSRLDEAWKMPAALKRWACGRGSVLTGNQSSQVLIVTSGSPLRKKKKEAAQSEEATPRIQPILYENPV